MAKIKISAKVGDKYTVRLKDFRIIDGHDDSLPYRADVLVNGVTVGTVLNDGWGGMSDFQPLDKCIDLCAEFNEYGANYALYPEGEGDPYQQFVADLTITIWDLCDNLAYLESVSGYDAERVSKCMGLGRHFQVNGNEWTLIYDKKVVKK